MDLERLMIGVAAVILGALCAGFFLRSPRPRDGDTRQP
jgi:hypothetical protein